MRYLILLFTLLFAITPKYYSQWSTDPNNHLIVEYGQDPHICSDSAGGCYIAYNDDISYPRKFILERINKFGYKAWDTHKEITGELSEQWQAEIIEDGEGGVIVGYEDNEWTPLFLKTRVRVQKIDGTGNFLWGANGTQVANSDTTQGSVSIVSDGDGGCVSAWVIYDEEYFLEYWVNRIDKDGNRVWGDSGKYLMTDYNYDKPRLTRASDGSFYLEIREFIYKISMAGDIIRRDSINLGYIVPDNNGGIILSGRFWTGMIPKLVAQKKDSLGYNLWQEPYVEIADSLDINTTINIKYNNGYIYYSWSGKKNGIDKVSQFQALRLDGTKLFLDGSLTIGDPPRGGGAAIIPLERNKTALIYGNSGSPDSLLVQVIDTLGNKLWNTNGALISYPTMGNQTYTTDGNNGFIIGGTINQFTIVAQQVSKNGNLGEIITSINSIEPETIPTDIRLYQNYPNPFNSTTIIKYQIPQEGRVRINLYNILGEKILTLFEGERERGIYSLSFSSNDLPSGNYFYSLESNSFREVKKLTILK